MSAGSKREATGPLSSSSDEDVLSSDELATSPETRFSLDHDYDSLSSPCSPSSSTSSDPVYDRKPGFTDHGHTYIRSGSAKKFRKPARCLFSTRAIDLSTSNSVIINKESMHFLPTKQKTKSNTGSNINFPMRMRALPSSFWQEPVKGASNSTFSSYNILPPLFSDETSHVRPVTPPQQNSHRSTTKSSANSSVKCEANTELLFSLFDVIKDDKSLTSKSVKSMLLPLGNKQITKKSSDDGQKHFAIKGEDITMVDAVTDTILPILSLEKNCLKYSSSIVDHEHLLALPSLHEQNYSHILQELAARI